MEIHIQKRSFFSTKKKDLEGNFVAIKRKKPYIYDMGLKVKVLPEIHPKFFWDTNFILLDWETAYIPIISRIIERGGQNEIDEIIEYYGRKKIVDTIQNEIHFLPNYAIDRATYFFPELKKEEMNCYLNRKDKSYGWI
ncbi:MAG: DUF6922 domain-containing protein [Chryseobacterium sp.]|uniref:DUF6922 domain-containing protein n=1 Tax=Chryseobacterium sp. TaxID=1871047 RepID=UPI003D0F4798